MPIGIVSPCVCFVDACGVVPRLFCYVVIVLLCGELCYVVSYLSLFVGEMTQLDGDTYLRFARMCGVTLSREIVPTSLWREVGRYSCHMKQ